MNERINDPVMYCLTYRNCLGDRRRYYVAERKVVESIKRKIDELSENGSHEVVFPAYSGARVVHNPEWECSQDSLEFIARSKKDAVSCAKEMGFRGLFHKLKRQN